MTDTLIQKMTAYAVGDEWTGSIVVPSELWNIAIDTLQQREIPGNDEIRKKVEYAVRLYLDQKFLAEHSEVNSVDYARYDAMWLLQAKETSEYVMKAIAPYLRETKREIGEDTGALKEALAYMQGQTHFQHRHYLTITTLLKRLTAWK